MASARSLLMLVVVALAPTARAQGWARTVETSDPQDEVQDVQPTADGGHVVACASAAGCWVLKLDSTGRIEWQRSFAAADPAEPCRVGQTSDGGYLVAGTTHVGAGNDAAPCVARLDASGIEQWQSAYWLGVGTDLTAFTLMPDDGAALAGRFASGGRNAWVSRLDAAGAPVFQAWYGLGGTTTAWAETMAPTPDGGVLLGGHYGCFLRLDAAGSIVAQQQVTNRWGPIFDMTLDVATDGWIVTGQLGGRPATLKLDAALAVQWVECFEEPVWPPVRGTVTDVVQTADGGFLLGGTRNDREPIAIKLDATGAVAWSQEFTSGFMARPVVAPTPDGGALVAGALARELPGPTDPAFFRLDAAGSLGPTCGATSDLSFEFWLESASWSALAYGMTPLAVTRQPIAPPGMPRSDVLVDLGDRYEHDSCASPARLFEGQTQPHDFCGDAEDWFVVSACEGVSYTLVTSALGPMADTVIEVLAPDCTTVLAMDDDGGGGLASRLDWIAPADGDVTVRVRQRDGLAGEGRAYDMTLLRSGPGCLTWVQVIDRRLADVEAMPDGSFVVAAGASSPGDDAGGPYLVRLDASGDVTGADELVGNTTAWLEHVERTADGGLVLAGLAGSDTNSAGLIVRIDASGAIAWKRSFGIGGPADFFTFARVRPLRDGGFAAVGSGPSAAFGTYAVMFRLDPSGNTMWNVFVLGWEFHDVAELEDGSFMIAGRSVEESGAGLIHVDSWGVGRWTRLYGDPLWPHEGGGESLALASDGSILLAAGAHAWKVDVGGVVQWGRHVQAPGGCGEVTWADLVATEDGGCIVAGSAPSCATSSVEAQVLRLGPDGDLAWNRILADPSGGPTRFRGLTRTLDGGIVLVGGELMTDDRPPTGGDHVVRLDADGMMRDDCIGAEGGLQVEPDSAWRPVVPGRVATLIRGTDPSLWLFSATAVSQRICGGNSVHVEVRCGDLLDDDGDGLVDCADPDCDLSAACPESGNCADGRDNDVDGSIDCADPDCTAASDESLHCADGLDNDLDALTDCDDGDCASDPACAGGDFDGDGRPNGSDCRPLDGTVFDVPPETLLLVAKIPGTNDAEVAWTDVAPLAGTFTVYIVAAALVSDLHALRTARGACVALMLGATAWTDTVGVRDDSRWYLVGAVTACGPPSGPGWGRDSLGVERPGCP